MEAAQMTAKERGKRCECLLFLCDDPWTIDNCKMKWLKEKKGAGNPPKRRRKGENGTS